MTTNSLTLVSNRLAGRAAGLAIPQLVAVSGADAIDRFLNFFATQIENDNTREAYLRAAREFLAWCEQHELRALMDILPIHVAGWIKGIVLGSVRTAVPHSWTI